MLKRFLFLAGSAAALAVRRDYGGKHIDIPISYPAQTFGKVTTNVSWGTPLQVPVRTTFDTGSTGFWVDDQNSIYIEEDALTGTSNCTYLVERYFSVYNLSKSTSHGPLVPTIGSNRGFSYGNSKYVDCSHSTNDTMHFGNGKVSLPHQMVALADNTTNQQQGSQCDGLGEETDVSIMGLAPGSTFRANLLAAGFVDTLDWSIWFEKPVEKAPVTEFSGHARFGGKPPASSHKGNLVDIPLNASGSLANFYGVNLPDLHINGKKIAPIVGSDSRIVLDTGTTQDIIPYNQTEMIAAGIGIVNYEAPGGFEYLSFNTTCDKIPHDATLDYTFFSGPLHANEKVHVKVPIKNYAQGNVPNQPGLCSIGNLAPDNLPLNIFGAPFFTAATVYFQDKAGMVGIAQGGV